MRNTAFLFLSLPVWAAPGLLLDRNDVKRIQEAASAQQWAAEIRNEVVRRADEWPASHVREYGLKEWALPPEGSGWSHAYVCPEHGTRLRQKAGKNLCPVDGKDYHGWPIDQVVYNHRNGDNARAVRDLGLAWHLTGKREYVEKARRILNAYSDLYPTLPIHDNNNKLNTKTGGRVMSQTLSESSWLMPLIFGYDLLRDELTPEERNRFETRVLREAAKVISRYDARKSNWQSWHNAALLAVGLEVKDPDLVKLAIDGPSGFKFQAKESITPDGPWYEGAWGYHFYTFEPLMLTCEMARRAGIAVPQAALKRMLDAPLRCVFPDGTLPAFSDSGTSRLTQYGRYYDIGYKWFHDPRYLALARLNRGLESLLWGSGSLPEGTAPKLASELLPAAGVATLRVAENDHVLAIKFGPHGSGHGHYDKLSFVSFADGEHLAVDPGTQAYAAKTHATWDKATVAHNTMVVDERDQAAAEGKLIEWVPAASATAIRASAGPVYPGVELERLIIQTAEYTLDVFDGWATDGGTHKFDWVYHNHGTLSCDIASEPYGGLPRENGYQHLTQTRSAGTSNAWRATFAGKLTKLDLRMLDAPDTTVVYSQELGHDLQVPVPFVMARRTGKAARFAVLYNSNSTARDFVRKGDDRFEVKLDGAADQITITPGKLRLSRRLADGTVRELLGR